MHSTLISSKCALTGLKTVMLVSYKYKHKAAIFYYHALRVLNKLISSFETVLFFKQLLTPFRKRLPVTVQIMQHFSAIKQ